MKFIVWVKDRGENVPECYSVGRKWVENGEGPLTRKTADRIAKETGGGYTMSYTMTKVLPVGQKP